MKVEAQVEADKLTVRLVEADTSSYIHAYKHKEVCHVDVVHCEEERNRLLVAYLG